MINIANIRNSKLAPGNKKNIKQQIEDKHCGAGAHKIMDIGLLAGVNFATMKGHIEAPANDMTDKLRPD